MKVLLSLYNHMLSELEDIAWLLGYRQPVHDLLCLASGIHPRSIGRWADRNDKRRLFNLARKCYNDIAFFFTLICPEV